MNERAGTPGLPDLPELEDRYELLGELRGTDAGRTYIARPRDGSAEVAIAVVPALKNSHYNELSHYAADIQMLESLRHPALARVVSGQWIGNSFAVVTERVNGDTLGEVLERGERFSNPRIALLLQEVSGLLDWAREKGIVHRTVTPDTIFFERDSNELRVMFTPAAIPITGVADPCADARTLGKLAWAMFTGAPYDERSVGASLRDVNPNLAARVIDATDRVLRCRDGAEVPDIATFLGVIGSGDALKQAEVELAAQKEEYDEAHRREIRKLEQQRIAVEVHAAEQAAALADEREEFARTIADERAAIEAERTELELLMSERKDRLAMVRAELDKQRAEMENRLAALEAYRAEVERARDDALAAAEKARQDAIVDARRWRDEVLAAAAAAGGASPEGAVRSVSFPKGKRISKIPIPAAPKALKEMKVPKWNRTMEQLDVTDEELIAASGRPRWLIPAGVATLVIILISALYGLMHRTTSAPGSVRVGNSTVVAGAADSAPRVVVPHGGFLTQPVGATSRDSTRAESPIMTPSTASVAAPAATRIDSAAGAVPSAAAKLDTAAARRRATAAGAPAAPPVRRRPTQAEIDSVNTAPEEWARIRRADSIERARRDSIARRRDTTARPDTMRRDRTGHVMIGLGTLPPDRLARRR